MKAGSGLKIQQEEAAPVFDLGKARSLAKDQFAFAQTFRQLQTLPDNREWRRKIVIFSTHRSGSTLLCDWIASTGLLGAPDEWLNPLWVSYLNKQVGVTHPQQALEWVARRTSSASGIFSVNVQIGDYLHWRKAGFDLLEWDFDDAIYLQRNDKFAQAYSLAKARAGNQWHKTAEAQDEQRPHAAVPLFMVLRALSDVVFWDSCFHSLLSPKVSRIMAYEEYLADPHIVSDLICTLAGIEKKFFPLKSLLVKQQTAEDAQAIIQLKQQLQTSLSA